MEDKQKVELFEYMPIPKAVAKLAIPTIISSLVMVIYNLADTYFVGMVNDPVQNAAVTLAAPVLLAFNAVNNLFGVGSSSMMSRALGRKDYDTVKRSSAFGFYSALGIESGSGRCRIGNVSFKLCGMYLFLRAIICKAKEHLRMCESKETGIEDRGCTWSMRRRDSGFDSESIERNRDDNSEQLHICVRSRCCGGNGNYAEDQYGAAIRSAWAVTGNHAADQLQLCQWQL